MTSESPTGCIFSSITPLKVKWETIGHHFAKIQSKVSSGWQAARNIHFASDRVPANGSVSPHGLLKIGVSTLPNSSSGYEIQGL